MDLLNILQSVGGDQGQQPTPPVNGGYTDPFDEMNFLEKLGVGIGGVDAVNSVRNNSYARQDKQREVQKMEALRTLGERVQRGEISREDAALEYAGISGNYGHIFGAGSKDPAALQVYDRVKDMTPEERDLFFRTRRGEKVIDLGGEQVVLNPQGGVAETYDKTLSPENVPENAAAKAKATATATQEVAQAGEDLKKSTQASEVIDLTKQAEELINVASGSYINTATSFGKRVVGISDEETQANAALKVIGGKLVSNQPRMEGPQSDRDVKLYEDMAANVADPTIPAGDKMKALEALRELQAKYANQAPPAPTTGGQRRTIKFGDLK